MGVNNGLYIDHRALIHGNFLFAVLTAQSFFESTLDTAFADNVIERIALIFELLVFLGVDRTYCAELVGEDVSADDTAFGSLNSVDTGIEVAQFLEVNDGLLVNALSEYHVDVIGEILNDHLVSHTGDDTSFLFGVFI